jgi:hypothetical protein
MRIKAKAQGFRGTTPVYKLRGHMAPSRIYILNKDRFNFENTMVNIDRCIIAFFLVPTLLFLVPVALMAVVFLSTAVLHFFS